MVAPRDTHDSVLASIKALATKQCRRCKGEAIVLNPKDGAYYTCPECGGWGWVVPAEDRDEYERLVALDKLMVRE